MPGGVGSAAHAGPGIPAGIGSRRLVNLLPGVGCPGCP
jgi:hypothetical protein